MPAKPMDRKILMMVSKQGYKPLELHALAEALSVPKASLSLFKQEVSNLHRAGRLVIGEDRTVRLADRQGTIVGTFRGHVRGFGFVVPIDPEVVEDLYIPPEAVSGALTSDLVQAKLSHRRVKGRMRLYGQIVRVLARGKNKFIGTLARTATHWMVQTDGRILHQSIVVADVSAKHARTGDRVVVQLTEYPSGDRPARGVILEVLGPQGMPDVELQAVIREYDLPLAFPDSVTEDLDRVIEKFNRTIGEDMSEGELPKGRLDLRNKVTITIDPVDARDFDDAITLDVLDDGYELGVHIADVSAFVTPGSPLDQEARYRGNSVYLPRKVIPMIPEALSNGLCSLQEGQDRLTKSAFIRYDKKGNVRDTHFANTVIRSGKRLHYEQASAVFEGDYGSLPQAVIDLLLSAEKLARAIYARREKAGMLHLDLPEVELEYNERGDFVDAHPADTSFSHTVIEMFMVEANEAVARLLDAYAVPFLRRIHPDPSGEAMQQLSQFLTLLGHRIPRNPEYRDLQELIRSVAGEPESFAVSYAVLRSLQRAEYSPKKIGHYALASKHYCHFTSPIRRYPDLDVHRLLQMHFEGKLKNAAPALRQQQPQLVELGEHCSLTEEQAQNAERQLKETLILELLAERIGQEYEGIITGVSGLGPFVRLQRFLIEGLVPLEELGNDFWQVDQEAGVIYGRRSGRRFRIGDPLKVAVVSADSISRRLNLALVEVPKAKPKKPEKKSKIKERKARQGARSSQKRGTGGKKRRR